MYNGRELTGPADLRDALLDSPEVFYRIFTENLMAYALGRRVEYYDHAHRPCHHPPGRGERLPHIVLRAGCQ